MLLVALLCVLPVSADAVKEGIYYLIHTSGCHLGYNASQGTAQLVAAEDYSQKVTLKAEADGYFSVKIEGTDGYLSQSTSNSWNTTLSSQVDDRSLFAFESAGTGLLKVKCKANGKYLGTDDAVAGAYVFCDKSGADMRHYWILGDRPDAKPDLNQAFTLNPEAVKSSFDGWGVSLCWWANMCGKWSDKAIDQIVDWLVSPDNLNFRIFRYNIGGGDDPQNRHCDPHHMGKGKGLRAEMEGFKDSTADAYHWDRDAAQRKIMLKIKEKRPDAIFEAFSNSCPYYMTYSGCCAGNDKAGKDNLRPEYYEEFAHYLVDVCKHYKDEYGIEFHTLDPFNEPQTSYWGRNGSQEGCHFDISSQVAFLKVLSPILKASGLNTVISASDETDVAQAVKAIKAYREAGVTDLVGQFNTHTYTANNISRTQYAALTAEAGKPMWMSEVGGGSGSGLAANLNLAQKLIDDIHYLQPRAWIDWQYIEDNDIWSLVRADLNDETTARRGKNYYVRQQFSRFIKEGYQILNTTNGQCLAARSADGQTYVIVALNGGGLAFEQDIDLTMLSGVTLASVKAYRTSSSESVRKIGGFKLSGGHLIYTLPQNSITTFVISASPSAGATNALADGGRYLISPRPACGLVIDASADEATGSACVSGYNGKPSQVWTLRAAADGGFRFENGNGDVLTAAESFPMQVYGDVRDNQTFEIEAVDAPYYRILLPGTLRAFDLENGKYADGTRIGLWEYGTSADATHRQWSFLRLPSDTESSIQEVTGSSSSAASLWRIAGGAGGLVTVSGAPGSLKVYTVDGRLVSACTLVQDPLTLKLGHGVYVLKCENAASRMVKVIGME